jgi:hypothetical protein
MESLTGTVSAIRAVADLLDETGQWLELADPGLAAFGADGPGQLGVLGRETYGHWLAVVEARVREARAHAARADDFAGLVGRAVAGFSDADSRTERANKDLDEGADPSGPFGAGVL